MSNHEVSATNVNATQLFIGPRDVVTQATSISTGVTINATSGIITTVDPALAAAAEAEFAVTNSFVAVGDVVLVCVGSGPSDNEHVFAFVSSVTLGAFTIVLSNLAAANQGDGAMTINFAVIKMP